MMSETPLNDDDQGLDGWTAHAVDGNPFGDHDPFSVPDSSVTRNQPARPYSPTPDPNAAGFSKIDQMVRESNAAHPDAPASQPPAPQYYGGEWGQSAENAYQYGMGKLGSAMDWLGDKVEQGVGGTAAAVGVPGAAGLGRDVRGMIETGEGMGGLHKPPEVVPRQVNPMGFYSHGADVAANLAQQRGTTQQMVAGLIKGGVKPVELQASGVQQLADTAPTLFPEKVRAEDLEQMFHKASPSLQETVLGRPDFDVHEQGQDELARRITEAEDASDFTEADRLEAERQRRGEAWRNTPETKFEQYVLPGPKENYREVLQHTPEAPRSYAAFKGDSKVGPDFSSAAEARDWARTRRPDDRLDLSVRETTPPDQPAPFTESHWDTPNVVAHERFSDRMGVGGDLVDIGERMANALGVEPKDLGSGAAAAAVKKGAITPQEAASFSRNAGWINEFKDQPGMEQKHLHLEELQSDWGQKGREEGFTRPLTPEEKELQDIYAEPGGNFQRATELERAGVGQSLKEALKGKHPPGPYVGNTQDWTDLGLKRALVEAARGDYTHLSWGTGQQQIARYPGLEKHISDLSYDPETTVLQARNVSGGRGFDEKVPREKLPDYLGREVSERLLAQPQGPHFGAADQQRFNTPKPNWQLDGWHTLSGEDLKVGGQGMRSYYDPAVTDANGKQLFNKDGSPKVGVLPTQLSKLIKKLDPTAKIGQSQLPGKGSGRYRIRQTGYGGYVVEDGQTGNAISEVMTPTAAKAKIQQLSQNTVHSIPITPLMRERILKGLPQYRRGGRVGFADGGSLESVDYNPFPPPPQVQDSDIARAKRDQGTSAVQEPRSPMHDRILAASQDVDPETGLASFDPATNVPREPQTQVYGGKWGKAAELGYEDVANAVSGAANWASDKLEQGVSGAAGAVGVPNPELLGRDVRAMVESPMLGEAAAGAPRLAEEPRPRPGATGSDVAHAAAPARAQIMDINGVKRHIDPEFPESRIGTSVPTNLDPDAAIDAEQGAHANNKMHVGMELAAQAPSSYGRAVANRVRDDRIPYVRVADGADDAAVQESLIEHMKNNLLGLYNRVDDAVRRGSKLWYEGANRRAQGIAETHDIPHENAAGVVAAMSPQKDWDQNVTLADWVAHTAGTTAPDATMTPEMTDWVNRYALRKDPENVVTDPATGKQTRFNAKTGEPMHVATVSQQDVQRQLAQVDGKPWGQMTPDQKAFYTRAYYEAHGPPDHLMPIDDQTGQPAHWIDDKGDRKYGYYINNPDGTHNGVTARYSDEYQNVKGQPIPVSWGSESEVANAIQAFHAQNMSDISEALGEGHKVRSFYNNIIAPWSKKGDVTSDTHAVAAALLRPLGAGSPEAASGMGAAAPGNNETGLKGFYPHVAEAYRRAARDAGILPRELQSITWEALRGLWTPAEKTARSNVRRGFVSPTEATNAIWQRYKNGEISMGDAHNAILGPNGERVRPPRWFNTFRP